MFPATTHLLKHDRGTPTVTITARSYLTAGVSLLGAGAIALTPIQPIPNHLAIAQDRVISDLAVNLATTVNPLQAVVDAFKTTTTNATTLGKVWASDPFPIAKVLGANWSLYAKELFGGGLAGFQDGYNLVAEQIGANLTKALKLPFDPGPTINLYNCGVGKVCDPPLGEEPPTGPHTTATLPAPGKYISGYDIAHTGDPNAPGAVGPEAISGLLLQLSISAAFGDTYPFPDNLLDSVVQFAPAWRFTATLASGLLTGALGPVLSPVASLLNSFNSFGANLKAGKYLDAFYDIVNIPVNMTSAFFNGAFLDLTGVVEKLTGIDLNPPVGTPGIAIGSVGINLGGLLNITPINGGRRIPPPEGSPDGTPSPGNTPTTEWNGGVLFNQIGGPAGATGFVPDNFLQGIPTGHWGSWLGFSQSLADELKNPPVKSGAAVNVAPAAAAVEAPAAPVVAEAPAPAVADVAAPAETPALDKADLVAADVAALAEAPAPKADSAPSPAKAAAASDNDGNDGPSRTRHTRARSTNAG